MNESSSQRWWPDPIVSIADNLTIDKRDKFLLEPDEELSNTIIFSLAKKLNESRVLIPEPELTDII